MDLNSKLLHLVVLFAVTVLVNLPFGYLRRKTRRYSFRWFLCIHIPIPFIFLARVLSHLDFSYIPFFVLAALIGQVTGGRIEL